MQLKIDTAVSSLEARDADGYVFISEPDSGDGSIVEQHAAASERLVAIVRAVNSRAELAEALEKIGRQRNRNLTASNKLAAIFEIVDKALSAQGNIS
jgi:hypothetical protein